MIALPAASDATGAGGVQLLTVTATAPPLLSCAVAVQLAPSAGPMPVVAVHTIWPLTVLPGLMTLGRPVMATLMSAGGMGRG